MKTNIRLIESWELCVKLDAEMGRQIALGLNLDRIRRIHNRAIIRFSIRKTASRYS